MEITRNFYIGVVEDNIDPKRKGRIKIRVQTLYHTIPTEDIPFAYPIASLAGKEFQVPAIGKLVNVLFLNNDLYSPYYLYSENYNENLKRKLESLDDEEYVDFTSLLFDETTQIFVKGKELTIDQLLNKITIDNSYINLELKDNIGTLNLGSRDSNQDAVLGTRFFKWMDKFIREIMLPSSIIGNMGAPILKPKLDLLCQEYLKLRPDFVSNNVKIVDNGGVKILNRTPDTINNKNDINLVIPPEEEPIIDENIEKLILEQNRKSCERLKNAAPSNFVPIRMIETNTKPNDIDENYKVRNKDNQNLINKLHPKARLYGARLINKLETELNTTVIVTSTFRSIERQKELLDSKNEDAAQPGRSYHQYGLAIDVWPFYKGKIITKAQYKKNPKCYPYWDEYGNIGKSLGFRWGKSFGEPWHFDIGFGYKTVPDLYTKYKNNDFIETNYVNLDKKNEIESNNNFKGQDYIKKSNNNTISTNEPCSGVLDFNFLSTNNQEDSNITINTLISPVTKMSDENEGPVDDEPNLSCNEKQAKLLLNQIAKGEGTTMSMARRENGAETEYDITYNYGKYTPDKLPSGKNTQPLTNLTIGEIKELQQIMIRKQSGNKLISSAVGKYQFISGTLNELVSKCNISDETLFSSETQDKLAIKKLVLNRGFNTWLNNNLSDNRFQKGLAQEWASIADPDTQKSYYNQHVGTTDYQIKEVMQKIKKMKC